MSRSETYQKTADLVRRYGFTFRKRFGQNFLTDDSALEGIVEASDLSREDLVIEIGPGIGTLTRYLSRAAGQVVAIEIDRDLVKILGDTLADCPNVRIVEGDVLKTDLPALVREYGIPPADISGGRQQGPSSKPQEGSLSRLKIVANLPYYITTPILMSLFEQGLPARRITVMVQKEVADRMCASCGSRDYGSLSLAVQYYSRPRIEMVVPASSFLPSPQVDSAVVSMEVYRDKPVKVRNEPLLKAIIRAAFGQRRKVLSNSLGGAPQIPASRQEVAQALEKLGLPASVRGEKLNMQQFADLTNLLDPQACCREAEGGPEGAGRQKAPGQGNRCTETIGSSDLH